MILVASAGYVNSGLQSEFGALPPASLPLANKKLYEHQVDWLQQTFKHHKIYYQLPLSYKLLDWEKDFFSSRNIELVFIPDEFDLSRAITYTLNTIGEYQEELLLLYGDTLFREDVENYSTVSDFFSVSPSKSNYQWRIFEKREGYNLVWSGLFKVSSQPLLLRTIVESKNFVDALEYYYKEVKGKPAILKKWLDFGHASTYFKSRAMLTTERAFNTLIIEDDVVEKRSANAKKIANESNWFEALPERLKINIPQLIKACRSDQVHDGYKIEYLYFSPLNEVYVHGRQPDYYWNDVFLKIQDWLSRATINQGEDVASLALKSREQLIRYKTRERIGDLFSSDESWHNKNVYYEGVCIGKLDEIVEDCIERAMNLPCIAGVLHGDLCFSNILLDSRSSRIKLIDPRGIPAVESRLLIGDLCYDVAKLIHSVVGFYDYIMAGAFEHHSSDKTTAYDCSIFINISEEIKSVSDRFIEKFKLQNITVMELMPATVLLFLSMIPLHADNKIRQEAMLINGFRLYKTYVINGGNNVCNSYGWKK